MTRIANTDNVKTNKDVLALATSPARKELKQDITQKITEVNNSELELLGYRNQYVVEEIEKSHFTFIVFGSLSEAFIILSFILLNHHLRQRNLAIEQQNAIEEKLLLANKQLQESEERYMLSTEGSAAGLWDWKVNTDYVFYSPYYKKILGYSEAEFPNTLSSFEKILHPADRERLWEKVNQHLENHTPFKMEYRLRNKAGEYRWIEAAGQALWDKDNHPVRMSGSVIDITERKKAEQRLYLQYALTKIFVEAPNLEAISTDIIREICNALGWQFGAMWLLNKKENVLACAGIWYDHAAPLKEFSEETQKLEFGYGQGLPGIVWKEGRSVWFADIEKFTHFVRADIAKKAGLKSAFGFSIMTQKQFIGVIECFSLEQEEVDTRILNLMATISLQIGQYILKSESEQALRKSEAYQTAILKSATDSIITINADNNIVSANPQTIKEFNYPAETLEGIDISKLIPGFDKKKWGIVNKPNIELFGIRKNGEKFPIEINLYEVNVSNAIFTVLNIRNITERKKVEKIKNEFVSVVSHELRTPITSIRGALSLILGRTTGPFSDKMGKLLKLANSNCDRLLALINDILDMEKIEAGKMNFYYKKVQIEDLVKEAVQANKIFAEKYHIQLNLTQLDHAEVYVDPDRLMQVLTNLISNAVKFSPAYETVSLSAVIQKDLVRISVMNKGAGIPLEFQSRIFQKFTQADTSDTRGKGGTGLGLSISKAIVEKLGGELSFASRPNKETIFFIDLPIVSDDTKPPQTSSQDEKEKILICEDDEDQAKYLATLLESAGFQVDTANSAQNAKKLLNDHEYRVLLLDLILPDEDGITLIQELRKNKKTANLPIVVLSIIAQTGKDLLNQEQFPVSEWLEKPVNFDKLILTLKEIQKQTYPNLPTILYVEDDQNTLALVQTLLDTHAHVETATTLLEAKKKLKQKKFDLLILDFMLPDGHADQLLPLIAQYKTPVIIYSALELENSFPNVVKHVLLKSKTSNMQLLNVIRTILDKSPA